jgi:serine/threonine protein kinase/tetratricopeptide (TPR) repeat protein
MRYTPWMKLAPGSRIGNYEVLAPQGAGGMGEVFRARDTRLDRTVAIKSLPLAFAADGERLARFEREAKLLASLTHPNIAGIFGIEDLSGSPYLVLEFVEGETLAQRLGRGPLSVRETVDLGVQIAAAVEAAHERAIVHRDLKPGNVMITGSGVVKVLDFGLAKGGAVEDAPSPDLSQSPTVAASPTAQGIILGTAPYMSPEQARGKVVDRRTDVWAFGCVLYECLTARPAFAGDTVSDVIARVLERDPDWSALPSSVPPRLRELMHRCLTKEPADRPRDIGDLRLQLNAIATQGAAPAAGRAASDVPSLAVLYFENLSSDKESEYFCAGITEDILTDLSKIKGLRVASRNAVVRYRGTAVDPARVASELGVRAVLEGSVRRAGDRVRISAQLINGSDGFHLWAERYDRTLEDVFAVQEEIAKSIAEALRVTLSPAETKNLVQGRPDDVRAYDLYLRGREAYGRYTRESLAEALDLFHQAIALDSNYALAWAGIADCHGQMIQYDFTGDVVETGRLGLAAARRAIALNPSLPEAHKAEALVLLHQGDLAGSVASLERALEANPRFTPALINLGVNRVIWADLAGAERCFRFALEVDPEEIFTAGWLATVLRLTSRGDAALEILDALVERATGPFYATMVELNRVMNFLARGDYAAAERARQGGLARGGDPLSMSTAAAAIAARTGKLEEARKLLATLEGMPTLASGAIWLGSAAAIRVGETARCAELLGRKLNGKLVPSILRLDPELHPLLDHAPFAPRRSDATLVWPLEAPMIDAARFALFKEVRIESGLPSGSAQPI